MCCISGLQEGETNNKQKEIQTKKERKRKEKGIKREKKKQKKEKEEIGCKERDRKSGCSFTKTVKLSILNQTDKKENMRKKE